MLRIGGVVPMTTQDYPGKLACVVFVRGCPWRCSYCHNPHLQSRQADSHDETWASVLAFLKRRQGLLDGVVFSGGEPTVDSFLPEAISQVKAMGFSVALHTAGCYPERLASIVEALDWVGLDIKAGKLAYQTITQVADAGQKAFEALDILLASGIDFECRCTISPDWLPEDQLQQLAVILAAKGVKKFVLQPYRPFDERGPLLTQQIFMDYPSEALLADCRRLFSDFLVR